MAADLLAVRRLPADQANGQHELKLIVALFHRLRSALQHLVKSTAILGSTLRFSPLPPCRNPPSEGSNGAWWRRRRITGSMAVWRTHLAQCWFLSLEASRLVRDKPALQLSGWPRLRRQRRRAHSKKHIVRRQVIYVAAVRKFIKPQHVVRSTRFLRQDVPNWIPLGGVRHLGQKIHQACSESQCINIAYPSYRHQSSVVRPTEQDAGDCSHWQQAEGNVPRLS